MNGLHVRFTPPPFKKPKDCLSRVRETNFGEEELRQLLGHQKQLQRQAGSSEVNGGGGGGGGGGRAAKSRKYMVKSSNRRESGKAAGLTDKK
jgi:hypothetical protein